MTPSVSWRQRRRRGHVVEVTSRPVECHRQTTLRAAGLPSTRMRAAPGIAGNAAVIWGRHRRALTIASLLPSPRPQVPGSQLPCPLASPCCLPSSSSCDAPSALPLSPPRPPSTAATPSVPATSAPRPTPAPSPPAPLPTLPRPTSPPAPPSPTSPPRPTHPLPPPRKHPPASTSPLASSSTSSLAQPQPAARSQTTPATTTMTTAALMTSSPLAPLPPLRLS